MFVRKSTHQTAVLHYEALMDVMRVGHLAEVRALREQISDLKQLAFVPKNEPSLEAREADAILSASEKHPEMSEQDRNRMLEGDREMDLLLGGTYDEDLLN